MRFDTDLVRRVLSRTTSHGIVVLVIGVMGVGVAAAGVTLAAKSITASGGTLSYTWAMSERFGDFDGDGIVEQPQSASYVKPQHWLTTFDACASSGHKQTPGATYKWSATKGTTTVNSTTDEKGCKVTLRLPSLGEWSTTAKQLVSGKQVATVSQKITLVDKLIVSVGDSIGSGEGNPDGVGARQVGAFPFYTPVWADRECHRTSLAGSAQAALRLERRDPHSSVTFLHLACSGATVEEGLLGSYEGIEPDPADGVEKPQIDRAVQLAAGRKIDAMLVSIGANNAKFSSIVANCVQYANCHSFSLPGIKNAKQIYDENIKNLAPAYAKLDDKLDPLVKSNKIAKVYLTEYFDPSTNDDTTRCGGGTHREREGNAQPGGAPVDGVTKPEWDFASNTVVAGLNAAVRKAVEASDDDGSAKWAYVGGIASAFKGHGYCAVDRWARTLVESFTVQQNKEGSFHPNSEGHSLGYAKQIELATATPLGIGGTPVPFTKDPAALLAANGLGGFVGALDQLNAGTLVLDGLPLQGGPFITGAITKALGVLADVQAKIEALSAQSGASITRLDNALDDLDEDGDPLSDVKIPGVVVDIGGTILPHAPAARYDVQLSLKVSLDEGDPALAMLANGIKLGGQSVEGRALIDSKVDFVLEPKLPSTAKRFSVPATATLGSVGYAVEADFGDVDPLVDGNRPALALNAGIASVEGKGTLAAEVHADFTMTDPNKDGVIDLNEMKRPGDIFGVSCGSKGARIDLGVTSRMIGLGGAEGKIALDDPDLCDGITTPTVTLNELQGMRDVTPADIINAIAQLSTLLSSLQTAGDLDLPFVEKGLRDVVAFNERLVTFFVDNGLTDPANPMATITIPADKTQLFDTVEEILPPIAKALGLPAPPTGCKDIYTRLPGQPTTACNPLGLRWDDGRLLFDFIRTYDPPALTEAGLLDVGDQLKSAGLEDLVSAQGAGAVTIDPVFSVDMGLGVDLRPDLPLGQRAFLRVDDSKPEVSADAPINADIDLDGRVAIVDVEVKDSAAGAVPILRRKAPTVPMLRIDINGKGDNRLTLDEAGAFLAEGKLPITAAVNAEVPSTSLTAKATIGGAPLGEGSLTVAWPDVSKPDGLAVNANAEFTAQLMPLAFDLENPQASLGHVLSAIRLGLVSVQELLAEDPKLGGVLPLLGTRVEDVDPVLTDVRKALDDLIAANDKLTLAQIEAAAEKALGEALAIPNTKWGGLLTLGLQKATTSGTTTVPAAIMATVDLSVCSTGHATGRTCGAVIPPLKVPVNLQLGDDVDGTGIAELDSQGSATVEFDAAAKVTVGVQLPTVTKGIKPSDIPVATGQIVPFLDGGSTFELGIGASATVSVQAALGPVQVSLGTPQDPLKAGLAARYRIAQPAQAGQRLAFGSTALDAFLAAAVPDPAVGVREVEAKRPTCGATAADACAVIPVYLGSGKLGAVDFRAPNLLQPDQWTFTGLDELLANLQPTDLALDFVLQGLDQLAGHLEQSLAALPADKPVPFLGTDFGSAADFVGRFRTGVVQPAQTLVTKVRNSANTKAIASETRSFFVTNVGPASSLKLLRDVNNSGAADGGDITVTMRCQDPSTKVVADCSTTERPASHIVSWEVGVPLGASGSTSTPPLDLGFPGLRLESATGVSVKGGFAFDLKFGVDKEDGFYLPVSGGAPELQVFAEAAMPNDGTPAPDVWGDLVFLPVSIEDKHAGPDVKAAIGVDIATTRSDGRVTLQQLDTLVVAPTVSACANIQLGLVVDTPSLDGATAPSGMPRIMSDLVVAGGYGCSTNDIGAPPGNGISIAFNNVAIDPGEMFRDFIGPAVREVRQYTGPLEPVVDALRKPIPGVAEAADAAGLPKPVWYDLLKVQDEINRKANPQQPSGLQVVDRVVQVIDLVRTLDAAGEAFKDGQGTSAIPIGSFTVLAADVDEPVPAEKAGALAKAVPGANDTPLMQRITGLKDSVKQKVTASTSAEGGLAFPIIDKPTSIFQVLVGKDVPLVTYDAGRLEIFREARFAYPIGPAEVYIGGSIRVQGHFAVGYDTFGMRRAVSVLTDDDESNDGFFTVTGGLVQGFYVDDRDKNGVDVPEIRFDAELTVGAAVGIPGLSVGAEGGVHAGVVVDLKDPDGKLRFEEMGQQLSVNPNPLCFFSANLTLDAFVRLVVRTPFGTEHFPIASVVLLQMDDDDILPFCSTAVKPLAELLPGGVLNVLAATTPDNYTLEATASGKITVSTPTTPAQTFEGVTKVYADLRGGADSLTMTAASGVTAPPSVICGGSAGDTINVLSGKASIYGDSGGSVVVSDSDTRTCTEVAGGGKDTLTTGSGADQIDGGPGNDVLVAGGGNDSVVGGPGDDVMTPGLGNDSVQGQGGKDQVDYSERTGGMVGTLPGPIGEAGTGEADTMKPAESDVSGLSTDVEAIVGGKGADQLTGPADVGVTLVGGDGDDVLAGGGKNDAVDGGPGNDTLRGGGGSNALYGATGDDAFPVGPGADAVYGGAGVDRVDYSSLPGPVTVRIDGVPNDGQKADAPDNIVDVDILVGTKLADTLVGGSPGEQLLAGEGNDRADGGPGDDTLRAATGDDGLEGGSGNDLLEAGPGDDSLSGGEGADVLQAEDGRDRLRGGEGDDQLLGGNADDQLFADAGGDVIDGGEGTDSVDYSARFFRVVVDVTRPGCDGHPVEDAGGRSGCPGDDVRGTVEVVKGGLGNDVLVGDGSDETLEGGLGKDVLVGGGGADTLSGGTGDDLVYDRSRLSSAVDTMPDTLTGGLGDDIVIGQGGADVLSGDQGSDTLRAGDAADVIDAGVGDDTVRAGGGADTVNGGDGADQLSGEAGNDTVNGGAGNDGLLGGAGSDRLDGGAGRDTLEGADGAGGTTGDTGDTLSGGDGDDRLHGALGDDRLSGGQGNDRLEGGDGSDRVDGGAGNDDERGGAGDDLLVQGSAANGADVLVGDDGTDEVDYGQRSGAIAVTKDGEPNDGASGEKDDVADDVEQVVKP